MTKHSYHYLMALNFKALVKQRLVKNEQAHVAHLMIVLDIPDTIIQS